MIRAAATPEHIHALQPGAYIRQLASELCGITIVKFGGVVELRMAQAGSIGAHAADPSNPWLA